MKKLSLLILSLVMLAGLSLTMNGCGMDANNLGEVYSAEVEFRFVGSTHVTRANGDYIAEVLNRETSIPGSPEVINLDFTEYNFDIGRSFIPVANRKYQVDVTLSEQNRYEVIRIFTL